MKYRTLVCYARHIAMKVAIQGELGSFSHEAAGKMLAASDCVPCARSAEVFDRVEKGSVQAAVIPIENSLAGSVAEHFDLLLAREVFIHGELHLRIRHNLIAPPDVSLNKIRRVFSHPVALDQCRNFFALVPACKPFLSMTPRAACATSSPKLCPMRQLSLPDRRPNNMADTYCSPGMEDDQQNYTRFLLINKSQQERAGDPTRRRSASL